MSLMIIEHGEYSDFMYHVVDVPDGVTPDGLYAEWKSFKSTLDPWDYNKNLPYDKEDVCYEYFCRWLEKFHPEIGRATVPTLRLPE